MADIRHVNFSRERASGQSNSGDRKGAANIPFPEELLRYFRLQGWTQDEIGIQLGVSRQSVNAILNGRSRLSPQMSERLGRLTGHPDDYWLLEQQSLDEGSSPVSEASSESGQSKPFIRGKDDLRPDRASDLANQASHRILVDYELTSYLVDGLGSNPPVDRKNVRSALANLRFGTVEVIQGRSEPRESKSERALILRPGESAVVTTLEEVRLTNSHIGKVGATVALIRQGISVSTSLQVEPGFSGCIHVILHNHGRDNFEIERGSPFLSLEIQELAIVPRMDFNDYQNMDGILNTEARHELEELSFAFKVEGAGRLHLTAIPNADICLKQSLQVDLEKSNGQFTARSLDLNLCGKSQTVGGAVQGLIAAIKSRFCKLRTIGKLAPRMAAELAKIARHVALRDVFRRQDILEIGTLLDAKIVQDKDDIFIEILDHNDAVAIMIDISSDEDIFLAKDVAAKFAVNEEQLFRLVSGGATRKDYLKWIDEEDFPEV